MTEPKTTVSGSAMASLQDALLVHCRSRDLPRVTEVIGGDPGCGVVLTPGSMQGLRQRLRHLQRYVPAGRILLDAGRYAGKSRKFAQDAFTPEWIALQRELGLSVIPDVGYIDQGDDEGLRSILRRTRELGVDALAPLGLHSSWLADGAGLDALIEAVNEANVPIAVMLEHSKDPFSAARTLRGTLRLIREVPNPVIFLRCDLSSIGLLCHGAHAAAVGTTSGLRHIYPLTDTAGGRPPKASAVVRQCLSYVSLEKIFTTVQADPENQMWVCDCLSCNGETIDQMYMRRDPEAAAFAHSVEVLRQLRFDLVVNAPPSARAASWASECSNALFRAEEMAAIDTTWPSPRMLDHWTAAHPATRHH